MADTSDSRGRDIVVVGASAGGVEALTRLVGGLPRDLPAALFVVLHVPPTGRSAYCRTSSAVPVRCRPRTPAMASRSSADGSTSPPQSPPARQARPCPALSRPEGEPPAPGRGPALSHGGELSGARAGGGSPGQPGADRPPPGGRGSEAGERGRRAHRLVGIAPTSTCRVAATVRPLPLALSAFETRWPPWRKRRPSLHQCSGVG